MANLSSEIRYNLVLAASSVMASIGGYSIAYRWLEALKKRRPERLPNTLDHLAVLAENRGLLNEALAQLVEADQVDPGNAFRHFEMGLLYEKMGDRRSAAWQMERSLELGTAFDGQFIAKLKESIANLQRSVGN